MGRVLGDGVGRQLLRLQREPLEPGVLVGCEHRERLRGQRQDFAFLENHLVLVAGERAPVGRQRRRHGRVARDRLRFVVGIDEHRVGAQLGGQLRYRLGGRCVTNDESATKGAQLAVQLRQAGVDKGHAAVVARQRR